MNSPHEFARLHAAVRDLAAAGFAPAAALATITRTHGSTFRHAGASMLVRADGAVVCALSGGCPQRDIVLRAQRVIAQGCAELARYDRESGLDVLLEMGCGGELEVLIEPLREPADVRFFDAVAAAQAARAPGVLATRFARDGRALTPRPQRLVAAGATQWHDLTDPALAARLRALGEADGAAQTRVVPLASAAGTDEVLLEPLRPPHVLHLVGVNAAAFALARLGAALGWECILVDDADAPRELPPGVRFVRAAPATWHAAIRADAAASVVVMTFRLERDLAWLAALREAPLAYLGAIASRERSARLRAAAGAALYAPAGLDLGAETPEEIALAVAAEILAVLNCRSAASLGASGQR